MKKIVWLFYAIKYVFRQKSAWFRKRISYCKRKLYSNNQASDLIAERILNGKPFVAGRFGLFELAVMRMYEFKKRKKYALVMNNLYNCAGFFPNDIVLGDEFNQVMKDSLREMDVLARNGNLCEDYFINHYSNKELIVAANLNVFQILSLEHSWTYALKGKKVLVVTPFTESVKLQYQKREKLFVGTDILPEFELLTYQSLMTVGDLKDDRFVTWFEALDFMKKEILEMDFDIALLGCGAYGFPLAAEIKKAGKQAIHMGGTLQLLFGIMGKRWDGMGPNNPTHEMFPSIKKYYNENWIYPIEEKPTEASKVEYGPYWK